MATRRGLAAVTTAMLSLTTCGGSNAPACEALSRVARELAACDPALGPLAEALTRQGDELACRVAARRVLDGPRADPPRVRSVWKPEAPPDTNPLSAEELASLSAFVGPAELLVVPDVAPAPGVPATVARVHDISLEPDERGRLRGHLSPGFATLRLRHAGRESTYCLQLSSCETLRVTAHGERLARHPDVHTGACRI